MQMYTHGMRLCVRACIYMCVYMRARACASVLAAIEHPEATVAPVSASHCC